MADGWQRGGRGQDCKEPSTCRPTNSDSDDGDGATVTFKDCHGTDELDLAEMGDFPGGEDSD